MRWLGRALPLKKPQRPLRLNDLVTCSQLKQPSRLFAVGRDALAPPVQTTQPVPRALVPFGGRSRESSVGAGVIALNRRDLAQTEHRADVALTGGRAIPPFGLGQVARDADAS